MTAAVIVEGIAILALLVLLFAERRGADQQATAKNESYQGLIDRMDQRAIAERRELLTRIQHPHVVPTVVGKRREGQAPRDVGNLAKVGTITPPRNE